MDAEARGCSPRALTRVSGCHRDYASRGAGIVALAWIAVTAVIVAPRSAPAQTLSPVIVEHHGKKAQAKFELAEAARDNGGTVIVAADTLEFACPREFLEHHRDIVVTVGDGANDLAIASLHQEPDGIVARVAWRGTDYELRAPLYGLHQGRNIALVFAAACSLGLPPEDVITSLKSTPQIAHRLELKRQGDGTIVIDDAYNSNPVGFASALGLLDVLRRPDGRRILVTPGMVELGSEHEAEHARIGRLAAEHVDVLLAVAPHRVAPLVHAFSEAAPQRQVVSCAGFAEARLWLDKNLGGRDVVLIENDLPDLLERQLRL